MELEFDKEIDALMRTVGARGSTVGDGAAAHLDADELSAFAENAMPEKTRALHLAHLADCNRCRGVLSGIIAMSRDDEPELDAVAIGAPDLASAAVASADVPWYRGLFAFPNLAYVMGGLVLVFGGLITVSLLRQNADNVSVSQTTQADAPASRGQAPQAASAANAASNSNAHGLIPGEPTPQIGMADPRPELTPPTGSGAPGNAAADVLAPSEGPTKTDAAKLTTDGVDTADAAKPAASAPALAPPPPAKDAERREDDAVEAVVTTDSAKGTVAEKKRSDDGRNRELSARQTQDLPRTQAGGISKAKPGPTRDAQQPFPNRANNTFEVPENRRVGGKNFQFRNGAWYDTQYRGQSTNSVKRGSDEYRKLDAGLRSIAEGLYGVVVVVWQDKAYKIR